MFFDAFGRLALGQISQVHNSDIGNAGGVSATGAAGTISGAIAVGVSGVGGTGTAGTQRANPAALVIGVSAQGSVGLIGFSTTSHPTTGVSATGSAGQIIGDPGGGLTGVQATGGVGNFQFIVSGGSGAKAKPAPAPVVRESWDQPQQRGRRRTGLEPVKKLPAQPRLVEAEPKFVPPAWLSEPAPPIVAPPPMPDFSSVMPDVMALQSQIRGAQGLDAQDVADINDILAQLDAK